MFSNILDSLKFSKGASIPVIGLMSGTSLDGLDICLAEFTESKKGWIFEITEATTIAYPQELEERLRNAMNTSAYALMKLDVDLGRWMGERVKEFLINTNSSTALIGSHGHTVFHDPINGFSTQIGSGAHIAAIASVPCVCNFRVSDIARGGQGAPLVPIGDDLLFGEFTFCLNLGGFSNISFRRAGERVAFDICPVNIILNHLSRLEGKPFDHDGNFGQQGEVFEPILNELNELPYYEDIRPKSLGKEWFESSFLPVVNRYEIASANKFRTVYEHIAIQIAKVLSNRQIDNVLVTGGGAKNTFLIDLLKKNTSCNIQIPLQQVVDFKEALIFGFLALLYIKGIPNCLGSATGASSNSIGGCLFF